MPRPITGKLSVSLRLPVCLSVYRENRVARVLCMSYGIMYYVFIHHLVSDTDNFAIKWSIKKCQKIPNRKCQKLSKAV